MSVRNLSADQKLAILNGQTVLGPWGMRAYTIRDVLAGSGLSPNQYSDILAAIAAGGRAPTEINNYIVGRSSEYGRMGDSDEKAQARAMNRKLSRSPMSRDRINQMSEDLVRRNVRAQVHDMAADPNKLYGGSPPLDWTGGEDTGRVGETATGEAIKQIENYMSGRTKTGAPITSDMMRQYEQEKGEAFQAYDSSIQETQDKAYNFHRQWQKNMADKFLGMNSSRGHQAQQGNNRFNGMRDRFNFGNTADRFNVNPVADRNAS